MFTLRLKYSDMGFFSALFKAATTTQPPREVIIQFDANWYDSWQSLEIEESSNPSASGISVSVAFEDDLLEEICASIENHEGSDRILYDEEQQPINNVGESYRQESIAKFCAGTTAEDLGWMSGFLLPEMANPHDKTAVAIYVIKKLSSGEDKFELLHGGYMDKESAKKVHKKILNLMGKDQFIPLLTRIVGGTPDKPNFGVFAYAKTKAIKFP
jgi:hypothetical protein